MKILLVHNFYRFKGGEDVYVRSLEKLLRQRGHTVITFYKDSGLLTKKNKVKIGIKLILRSTDQKLIQFIQQEKPDLVHSHNIYPLITSGLYSVCSQFKIPLVQTVHNYRPLCPKGTLFRDGNPCQLCITKSFKIPAIKYSCYASSVSASTALVLSAFVDKISNISKHIDHYLFPSKSNYSLVKSYLNNIETRSSIIPSFVFPQTKLAKPDIKGQYCLFVGRLSEEKGILELLETYRWLSNYQLIVVGTGPLAKVVNMQYKATNIQYKGYIPRYKLFTYYKNALATIIPSVPNYEFGPLVLMESYSQGTPVIAPRSGVFLEHVRHKNTGYLFEPANIKDLKKQILYVYNNLEQLRNAGINAKKYYQKHFSPSIHYSKLMSIYNKFVTS